MEPLAAEAPGRVELPSEIRLEASTLCQLRCPSCSTANKKIDAALGRGTLSPENFRNLLSANPGIKSVELSNYGEIFLNKHLGEILRTAHEFGVAATAGNGVNLNDASEDALEAVVTYRLRAMTVSIDGASQETYSQYRIRGDFGRVIENVKKINAYKERYQSEFPRLLWQFVVFGFNEHELDAARLMAESLGMHFHAKLSWDEQLSPIVDAEKVRAAVGYASRSEFAERTGKQYLADSTCTQLWIKPQINWNGDMLGCCRNSWAAFGGNVFDDGFEAVFNGDGMRHARRSLAGEEEARPDIPCARCSVYHKRKETGWWINMTGEPHSEG